LLAGALVGELDDARAPAPASAYDHLAVQTAFGSEIAGRASELAAIEEFVDSIAGQPSCLVLEGPAGVGKTTLWRAALDAARRRGLRVLETRPAQAEATLAFAGLGDLLGASVDDVIDSLPAPQAEALQVALMLRRPGAEPPGAGAVAVATLSAVRVLTAESPLLIAVDDVQWLDATTASVLAFAWRRMRDERLGVVTVWRTGERTPDLIASDERTRRLRVEPLSVGAVHEILRARLDRPLSRPALLRAYEVAGGNAFYALELGRALAEREVIPAPGEPLPVPERLRDLVDDRLAALSEATRDALAATAALSAPTLQLVAAEFGGEEVLRPAFKAQLLEMDRDRLRFAHPLLAAAAYERQDSMSRRALHRRLAGVVGDEEERARHLALAADGPDPDVAAELEEAAIHARSRGAAASAAELCELACRLTPPEVSDDGRRRLLLAGRYRWLAGDTPGAVRDLEEVVASARIGRLRAEAMVALAWVLQHEGDQPRAASLARSALAEPGLDDALRMDAAHRLSGVLLFMREELTSGVGYARLAAEIAVRASDPTAHALEVANLLTLETMVGAPEARETERRLSRLAEAQDWRGGIGSVSYDLANVLMWTDRHEGAASQLSDIHARATAQGDEGALPHVLAQLALADYLAGRWTGAMRFAEAGYTAAIQTGQRLSQAWTRSTLALVRASLGLENEARADASEALALAGQRGMAVARIQSVWALGLLELPMDRYFEAAETIAPLRRQLLEAGVGEPGTVRFVADEVEALVALGRSQDAVEILGWLEERGRALDRASALAAAARCRGLLAASEREDAAALRSFELALAEHDRVPMPFERARTLLALGRVQRRIKQRAAARATLGEALAIFEALGAELWAAKARRELTRIGGRTPTGRQLTVTERRIADLVAQGLSNKEIAAALFLTPKTVETQLSRIYTKLGVQSRTRLAVWLREHSPDVSKL
jgi:DNA-binding CsgD family transcriptional regulator